MIFHPDQWDQWDGYPKTGRLLRNRPLDMSADRQNKTRIVRENEVQMEDGTGYALLRGITHDQVERGQVLAKPGSIVPHDKFSAAVYVLTKDEGGRHTAFLNGYRPQFFFRTTDITGSITLPADVQMVMPGDHVTFTVQLIHAIALEAGTKFSIREGGKTVGSGTVAEILH